jgi:dTDP-glucose 4,6-dehydratase
MKLLVTGGAGFIGSAFVRLLARKKVKIVIVDKLTYAGDFARLKEIKGSFKFYKADICGKKQIKSILSLENPDYIVHFAAESHVDRSIKDSSVFVETNILGTQNLIEASRKTKIKKFIHISTDEVYGEISRGKFREDSSLSPNSPYSATKAAADLLVKSYVRTYGFPAIIVRPSNNYGPWQYPEKLIPLSILKGIRNEKVPVYAKGQNIREWLFVDDCAEGIFAILKNGRMGEVYNLGSGQEKKNIEVVKAILKILKANKSLIKFVQDRPGHDIRYSLNSNKIRQGFKWQPRFEFNQGLKITVDWCLKNKNWLLGKWASVAPLYK